MAAAETLDAPPVQREPRSSIKRKKRAKFQFSENELKRIRAIAEANDISQAEVLRRAFRLFTWVLERKDEDASVIARSQTGNEERCPIDTHMPEKVG